MTSIDDTPVIYHLFADDGVESEALAAVGNVYRVGLNPRPNDYSTAIEADATNLNELREKLPGQADLVVCHPECYRWATATQHIPDRENVYANQIPDARRVATALGDHYIIENVPDAPLREPVVLNGRMFSKPVLFERAFETSFPVVTPQERRKRPDEVSWWNEYSRPISWWKSVKGYSADHRKDSLVKSGIPRPYIDHLLDQWQATVHGFGAYADGQTQLTDLGGTEV